MKRRDYGKLLNLETDYIPAGRPNRSGEKLESTSFITIHNTSNTNAGADAKGHAKFCKDVGYYTYKGQKKWISWHYTVDDGRIVKHLPIDEVGWHAGSAKGNRTSIGIEICMNAGIDQAAAFERASMLVAALLFDLKKSAEIVVSHYYWSGKHCPILLLDNNKPGTKWKKFLSDVTSQLARIEEN